MPAQFAVESGRPEIHVGDAPAIEVRLRHMLEWLPVGAYLCDPEGLITYFNPPAVRIWGRSPKLNHPDDRFCGSYGLYAADGTPVSHDRCWMALALRDRKPYNGRDITIECPDGRRLAALAYANPLFDDEGELVGGVNVLVDVSERTRAEAALRKARAELAHQVVERTAELTELSRHLMHSGEADKARLAAELHDELGSLLTVLSMRVNRLRERLPVNDPETAEEHAQLVDLVRSLVVSQRKLVSSLRPPLLDTFGLGVALRHYVGDWSKITGIPAQTEIDAALPALPAHAALAIFCIAQEALGNVAKHANAQSVRVSVASQAGRLTLCIEDDGVGIAPGVARMASSRGMIGMRERALEHAGSLIVETGAQRKGTRLRASLPVAA